MDINIKEIKPKESGKRTIEQNITALEEVARCGRAILAEPIIF